MTLGLSSNYSNEFIDITKTDYHLSFQLQAGKNTVKTPVMPIGKLTYLDNDVLLAQLSFSYEFDKEDGVFTIDGADFSSEDSMCLTTFPQGYEEFCYQNASKLSIGNKSTLFHPNWNYNTPMTPGLNVIFTGIVKSAIDILIDIASKQKELTIRIKTPPPKLSPEEHKALLLVYINHEFSGLYNPAKDYGAQFTVKTIESVWGGVVKFHYREDFANVIGSTHDPKIGGNSWIRLWENQFGQATICTSYHSGGFRCNNWLVGGHVILGTWARKEREGSNDVYIMPICSAHNNDDNVYMQALEYQNGIWLKKYLQSAQNINSK